MTSQREFIGQVGYLTLASNTNETDYFRLAYMQAQSIKKYMPTALTAVIVDEGTSRSLGSNDKTYFDKVITVEDTRSEFGPFANEIQAFHVSPFKETIKMESDLVLTRSISHWIYGLRSRDLLFPTNITNFRNQTVTDVTYRNFFKINHLPNVYTGIYYFRYCQQAAEFFKLATDIFQCWNEYKVCWKMSPDQSSTDVVFAIAALLFGAERCTNPALSYPTMVHMKGAINGLPPAADWTEHLYGQLDQHDNLIVGLTKQIYPFHYYQKHWRINYD